MLAKEIGIPYPFLSEILSQNLFSSTGIAITKDFAEASVNGTIDNIQFPFFCIAKNGYPLLWIM